MIVVCLSGSVCAANEAQKWAEEKFFDSRSHKPVDPKKFPESAKAQAKLLALMEKMKLPKDGAKDIAVFVVDDLSVNAEIVSRGEYPVVLIHQGLLDFVKNDDELVAILGHEMEHLTAELDAGSMRSGKNDAKAFMLTRMVENEVDGKSIVNRVVPLGYNPSALSDFLNRLPGLGIDQTHTTHQSRIATLDGTVSYLARGKGEKMTRQYAKEIVSPSLRKEIAPAIAIERFKNQEAIKALRKELFRQDDQIARTYEAIRDGASNQDLRKLTENLSYVTTRLDKYFKSVRELGVQLSSLEKDELTKQLYLALHRQREATRIRILGKSPKINDPRLAWHWANFELGYLDPKDFQISRYQDRFISIEAKHIADDRKTLKQTKDPKLKEALEIKIQEKIKKLEGLKAYRRQDLSRFDKSDLKKRLNRDDFTLIDLPEVRGAHAKHQKYVFDLFEPFSRKVAEDAVYDMVYNYRYNKESADGDWVQVQQDWLSERKASIFNPLPYDGFKADGTLFQESALPKQIEHEFYKLLKKIQTKDSLEAFRLIDLTKHLRGKFQGLEPRLLGEFAKLVKSDLLRDISAHRAWEEWETERGHRKILKPDEHTFDLLHESDAADLRKAAQEAIVQLSPGYSIAAQRLKAHGGSRYGSAYSRTKELRKKLASKTDPSVEVDKTKAITLDDQIRKTRDFQKRFDTRFDGQDNSRWAFQDTWSEGGIVRKQYLEDFRKHLGRLHLKKAQVELAEHLFLIDDGVENRTKIDHFSLSNKRGSLLDLLDRAASEGPLDRVFKLFGEPGIQHHHRFYDGSTKSAFIEYAHGPLSTADFLYNKGQPLSEKELRQFIRHQKWFTGGLGFSQNAVPSVVQKINHEIERIKNQVFATNAPNSAATLIELEGRFQESNSVKGVSFLSGTDLRRLHSVSDVVAILEARTGTSADPIKIMHLEDYFARPDQLSEDDFSLIKSLLKSKNQDRVSDLIKNNQAAHLKLNQRVRLLQLITSSVLSGDSALQNKADELIRVLLPLAAKDSKVRNMLSPPNWIEHLAFAETKKALALFQLDQKFKWDPPKVPFESNQVRQYVDDIAKFITRQFPKDSSVKEAILDEVESRLQSTRAESDRLAKLRSKFDAANLPKEAFLLETPALITAKTMPYRQSMLLQMLVGKRDPNEFGIDKGEIDFRKKYSKQFGVPESEAMPHMVQRFRDASVPQRTGMLLQFMQERQNGILLDKDARELLFQTILGDSYKDRGFRMLFETYLGVIRSGERSTVLSYVMSKMADGDAGAGRASLKSVLEAMGPFGVKAGQFLASCGLLTPELQKELDGVFDEAAKPTRRQIHERLAELMPGQDIRLGKLAGSGSINYGVEAYVTDPKTGKQRRVFIRVQKPDVGGLAANESENWDLVAKHLRNGKDPLGHKIARVLEESNQAVMLTLRNGGSELDQRTESLVYEKAKLAYEGRSKGYSVNVAKPNDDLLDALSPKDQHTKISVYDFTDATKLPDIKDVKQRQKIAKAIIQKEMTALFDHGTFDPDGHTGNWLFDEKKQSLVRIDYAQLRTLPEGERKALKQTVGLLSKKIYTQSPKFSAPELDRLEDGLRSMLDLSDPKVNIRPAMLDAIQNKGFQSAATPHERVFQLRELIEGHLQKANPELKVALKANTQAALSSLTKLNGYTAPEIGLPKKDLHQALASHTFTTSDSVDAVVHTVKDKLNKVRKKCDLSAILSVVQGR